MCTQCLRQNIHHDTTEVDYQLKSILIPHLSSVKRDQIPQHANLSSYCIILFLIYGQHKVIPILFLLSLIYGRHTIC